jgi:hypothetical protein
MEKGKGLLLLLAGRGRGGAEEAEPCAAGTRIREFLSGAMSSLPSEQSHKLLCPSVQPNGARDDSSVTGW